MTGLTHIYYGEGKGKTTAAFGLALRVLGNGERVTIAQFLKAGDSGECRALKQAFGEQVWLEGANPCGKFSWQMNAAEKERTRREITALFERARAHVAESGSRLLVFDEIMGALQNGFLDTALVTVFLKNRPTRLEVVMTGRNPPETLLEMADYATEMRKIKHPFDRGISARVGIEL